MYHRSEFGVSENWFNMPEKCVGCVTEVSLMYERISLVCQTSELGDSEK